MKTDNSLRNSAGAALGLVAASLFIIFAIGLFIFFAGRLIGGNHELNRASDAGILSAAKQALVQPAVALNDPALLSQGSLPYNDFAIGLADQNIGGVPAIDLLTYNKCAAQAVLVGLEAEKLNNDVARNHAQQVASAVLGLGQELQRRFARGGLNRYYDETANANTLNMLGTGASVTRSRNVEQAYVSAGRPSNIYFLRDVVSRTDPNSLRSIRLNNYPTDPRPDQVRARTTNPYLPPGEPIHYAAGYAPITVMPGTSQASLISFVPVNPQSNPHAVDRQRFDGGRGLPGVLTWVPPNAFRADGQSAVNLDPHAYTDIAANNKVNAISCAVIGCGETIFPGGFPIPGGGIPVGAGTGGPQDQVACIPGGYFKVINYVDATSDPDYFDCRAQSGLVADARNFIANRSAFGPGRPAVLTVYIGTPIPADINKVVLAFDDPATPRDPGKAAMKAWIRYNRSVGSDGLGHDPDKDPMGRGGTPSTIRSGRNPRARTLRQGPIPNEKAQLRNIITVTGYVELHSLNIDGVTPVTDSAGRLIAADIAATALFRAAGPNVGEPPPRTYTVRVPVNNEGFTYVEAIKHKIIYNFARYFERGRYDIACTGKISGMKYFDFYNANGGLKHVSSPNDYAHQMGEPNPHARETPSTSQFMTVATPNEYLDMINKIVLRNGGFVGGQYTREVFMQEILRQVRLIRPAWTMADLTAALVSQPLPINTTMYLRDDGNGRLILTRTCPQDTGLPPDGNETRYTGNSNGNAYSIRYFRTLPEFNQRVQLMDATINTKKTGSQTAYTADCNVEEKPWRTARGIALTEVGCVMTKSSGFNNHLGQMVFYQRPEVNAQFSNPN